MAQPGPQFAAHAWTGEVIDYSEGDEVILTVDEAGRANSLAGASLGFRCVSYRSN